LDRPLKVLLGVSGGIAAVKVPETVRRLRERGHEVRCALTPNASSFVSPLSLEVLTGHPVYQEQYLEPDVGGEELHLSLAQWADVMCIVPATCNTIARIALGLADDFLTTTVLAFEKSLVIAPAMSTQMWSKPIVQVHMAALQDRGARLLGPVSGKLADGEHGMGRMVDPELIVAELETLEKLRDLAAKTVVIAAGPTREPLDPVRFISNRSSGKMGFGLAAEAAARGARTLLVCGPVDLPTPPGVERFDIETAAQMSEQVSRLASDADIVIMAAAVADFRPIVASSHKLKKLDGLPDIVLETNPDILVGLYEVAPNALRVGFAAETENLYQEAARKLDSKHADFIVANDVSMEGVGFDSDTNEVTVFGIDREPTQLELKDKRALAAELFDIFVEALRHRETGAISRS
jgi:phosphopantothenoylcysteine decarboxylase/phosphopantothenate--cysteine ligase